MELHFIINEFAGSGKGKTVWEQLKKELTTPSFNFSFTNYAGHASKIAKQICEEGLASNQTALIIAIGGDGTIHEVINGVIGFSNVLVGAVCAGSGNDFSRGYASFQSARQIDNFIKRNGGKFQEKDCGLIELDKGNQKRYFVNNTGIGFDAFVAYKTNNSKAKQRLNKIGLGRLSYIYFLLYCLYTYKLFNLTVQQGNLKYTYEKVWFATVSNQPYFGGGMKISPNSCPKDGVIELTIVYNISKLKLVLLFITVFFGAHTRLKEVVQISSSNFTLSVDKELFCHADGEIIGSIKKESEITYNVCLNSWKLANVK